MSKSPPLSLRLLSSMPKTPLPSFFSPPPPPVTKKNKGDGEEMRRQASAEFPPRMQSSLLWLSSKPASPHRPLPPFSAREGGIEGSEQLGMGLGPVSSGL